MVFPPAKLQPYPTEPKDAFKPVAAFSSSISPAVKPVEGLAPKLADEVRCHILPAIPLCYDPQSTKPNTEGCRFLWFPLQDANVASMEADFLKAVANVQKMCAETDSLMEMFNKTGTKNGRCCPSYLNFPHYYFLQLALACSWGCQHCMVLATCASGGLYLNAPRLPPSGRTPRPGEAPGRHEGAFRPHQHPGGSSWTAQAGTEPPSRSSQLSGRMHRIGCSLNRLEVLMNPVVPGHLFLLRWQLLVLRRIPTVWTATPPRSWVLKP